MDVPSPENLHAEEAEYNHEEEQEEKEGGDTLDSLYKGVDQIAQCVPPSSSCNVIVYYNTKKFGIFTDQKRHLIVPLLIWKLKKK